MYEVLLVVIGASIIIFMMEVAYVAVNMSAKIHAYLLLYITCCLVNNVGYLLEITAKSSEAAYVATRLLYLGKMNIAFAFLVFILQYCRAKVPKWGVAALFAVHQLLYGIVLTNDLHHWYYSSITFTTEGLFPHNVYGHGPAYYIAIPIPYVYTVFSLYLIIKTYRKLRTGIEKKQMLMIIISPIMSMVGTLVFFTGKTGGFDTGNIGLIFSSWFLFMPLFKYNLIDTVDVVKNELAGSLEDGLIAIDAYNNLAYVNDKAKVIFPNASKLKGDAVTGFINQLDEMVTSKEVVYTGEHSYVVRVKDLYQGELYRGQLFTLDDVTESLEYTRQIEMERDRADKANAAKSQFLSNMSHEIRTPMNAVIGVTDILLRNNPKESDVGYLEIIKSAGNSLLDIINDILDISKIESGKMEIVNSEYAPLPLINELKVIFATRVGEKPIELTYYIDEDLPSKLFGDSVRIRQILINLVNNAIKFTDEGFVKLGIAVGGDEGMEFLRISVSDSGQGIKEEDLGKLFSSFTRLNTTKNHEKEGSGLGLSITKQLVELMGGEISVKSQYGVGTTFSITIPQKIVDRTPASRVVIKTETKREMLFSASRAQVLLVEDTPLNVKVAQGILEPLKMTIDVAENGFAALNKVKEKKYDLVLMDHMMPVMDGVEATGEIRKLEGDYYKKLPIIALTADAVSGAKEQFLAAGMSDFVSKPIRVNEIMEVIRKWLPNELIDE